MRFTLGCVSALMLVVLAASSDASAAGKYFEVSYPASTQPGKLELAVDYTLWVPDGVQTIRGVIVHQHGASLPATTAGATAAYDLHWQALAKKWDCVLLGPSYKVLNDKTDASPGGAELWFDPRRGSEQTFLTALNELATKSGHAEIAAVPWVLWGHSAGAIWSHMMAMRHPERVVAVYLRSGSAVSMLNRPQFESLKPPEAMYAIPIMGNAGMAEKGKGAFDGPVAVFRDYRAKGAPIGFAPDPRTAHFCGDSRYLAIPFLDACLAMRLPEKGATAQTLRPVDMKAAWLAPLFGDAAQPAADYKGNASEAVWLPNEAVARAWMQYVKTGDVGSIEQPPAPNGVKAARGEKGIEVTWDAESGVEGGIGGFVVLRDGRGIARLPDRAPDRVFGRPLFQGLSFHDTPEQPVPLPAMRYLDTTAAPGKHTYTIMTLSSAGVRSEPSAAASVE